jgi:dihydropteroate synthase
MGILNLTPDSFSDGGQFHLSGSCSPGEAISAAKRMIDAGADLVDVGAESTRPGAIPIHEGEERTRLNLVLPRLAKDKIPFSVDTMKPSTAQYAIDHGAAVINDVTGLRNPQMLEAIAGSKVSVCIMHMQGMPPTMQQDPQYVDVVAEVESYLRDQAQLAQTAGIGPERIWVDPGIGFGKTTEHNLALLRATDRLSALGYPVLIGVSRKGFIGRLLAPPGCDAAQIPDRLPGSLAAQVIAQWLGARILRTHDVKAARAAAIMAAAIDVATGDKPNKW